MSPNFARRVPVGRRRPNAHSADVAAVTIDGAAGNAASARFDAGVRAVW